MTLSALQKLQQEISLWCFTVQLYHEKKYEENTNILE